MTDDQQQASGPTPLDTVQQARLQLALHALTQEHRNLVVHCPGPALAQAVADWLPGRLTRWWPQAQVRLCGADEGHRLLEALNASLQVQPPAASRNEPPVAAPQVWLVHASAFSRPDELGLLIRMLIAFQHLPLRVVLLLTPDRNIPADAVADGSGLYPVQLETPATDANVLVVPSTAAKAPEATSGPVPGVTETDHAPGALPSPLQAASWKLPAAVAATTVVIGALAWWSQQIGQPAAQPGPLAVTPAATGQMPATSGSPEPGTTGPAPAATSPASPATVGSSATAPQPVTAASAAPAAPAAPADGRQSAAAEPPATVQPSPPTAKAAPALPDAAAAGELRKARSWLRNLPAQSWLVEHSRHPGLAQAYRSRREQKHLSEARIVPVRDKGQTRYLVVTGPFRSAERAGNYQQRLKIKGQVHQTAVLRQQLAS